MKTLTWEQTPVKLKLMYVKKARSPCGTSGEKEHSSQAAWYKEQRDWLEVDRRTVNQPSPYLNIQQYYKQPQMKTDPSMVATAFLNMACDWSDNEERKLL